MVKARAFGFRLSVFLSAASMFLPNQFPICAKEPKLTSEELVSRHLASIGTPEARAAVKSRVAAGAAQWTIRMPQSGQIPGKSSILSDGGRLRITLAFGAQESQMEQLVFDGKNVDAGQIQLRERSWLSDFVYHHDVLLKEGLMLGTMTTAWPLLDLAARQPKLDYTGLKKTGGRQMHEVKYRAKKDAGDVQVALYFDPESFRHVHTEYRLVVRAGIGSRARPTMGNVGTASPGDLMDTYYKIDEWFEDFRIVDGLTLPHACKLAFTREGPSPFICEYGINLTQILHNQEIDPKSFVIQYSSRQRI
jgi:hypothetical protein